MRSRDEYLDRERQLLAPYAAKAAESRGRAHAEPEHPLRSPFERDRDRIIHSSAFRKLEYKTQVFVNHEGDYYRTRLTHTLEASQITRSLARFLHLNEDLAEAVALVHDVGHPPFGHAGEEALQGLMEAHGGFEHNLQALRVVDFLESPYPEFPGLNLTWEVREGIVKHSRSFAAENRPPLFDPFAGERWPSLEAQLADACDEIAYNAHDLDDGLTAGLITLSELERVPLWKRLAGTHGYANLTSEQAKYLGVRALINEQVQDVARTVERRVAEWGLDSVEAVRAAADQHAGPDTNRHARAGRGHRGGHRLGQPADHVGATVFLASDMAAYMTGAMVNVVRSRTGETVAEISVSARCRRQHAEVLA